VRTWPTRGRRVVDGSPGDTVSIIPVAGDAIVTTSGLRWPLSADVLSFGSSRGVSNLMTTAAASVEVHRGAVIVTHLEGSG
jgi:thiamine pyrophosphokinase